MHQTRSWQTLAAGVAAATLSAWLSGGTAQAQFLAQPRATNLPGVTTSAAPPAGFEPLTAGDDALAAYGFPPRPDVRTAPQAYARWAHAVGAHPQRLVPELRETGIYHGPLRSTIKNSPAITSSNWSGYAAPGSATVWSGVSFSQVQGQYIVPAVDTATCNGEWDYSASWVGIDGYRSDDVLQAGTEHDAVCGGGQKSTYYGAWYE